MSDGRRFTRRDVLSGAAVAGAGALLGPVVARGAVGGAGGAVFGHAVGTLSAQTAPVISPRRRFSLVAVRWSTPAHARIELRARRADGRWGPWGVASSDGHDGDGVTPHDHVGEGIWTGPGTEVQLRSARTVHGVRLQFVAAEAGAAGVAGVPGAAGAAAALALATPTLPAGSGQPPIVARQVWAGAGHPPRRGPFYGAIEMGVVHHSENPNGYSAADVPALLRAIYAFHVFGRGWWDIGYNYLVDRFGRIWEGREGGIDLPVIGAQAGDWNTISFGVAMLGTYTDIVPSAAAIGALERLLAWKMALNGLPVIGEIAAVVAAEAVSWTQFRAGEHVHFPRIAGHRDVDSTACPGDALYGHLPAMRPRIARLAGPLAQLTLAAELDELVTGPVLALRGRLTDGGRPLAAAAVEIQAVGQATPLATVTTGADGRWSATLVPRRTMQLRALHRTAPAVVSPLLQVSRGTASPPLVQ